MNIRNYSKKYGARVISTTRIEGSYTCESMEAAVDCIAEGIRNPNDRKILYASVTAYNSKGEMHKENKVVEWDFRKTERGYDAKVKITLLEKEEETA